MQQPTIALLNHFLPLLNIYLSIALRNLYKYKLYSLVNIIGLALGIAFFTLILLLIRHELSYDKIHPNYKRIYRAIRIIDQQGIGEKAASMPFPFAPTVKQKFPDYVEETVRIFNFQVPNHTVVVNGETRSTPYFYFADPSFFRVFSFPLQLGDPETAMQNPLSVLLSHRAAEAWFGQENPLGKTIAYEGKVNLTVTGVFAPKDYASHFQFDFIAPFGALEQLELDQEMMEENWKWDPCWTYILLDRSKSPEDLEVYFEALVNDYFPKTFKGTARIFLQPLSEIHLYSDLDYELAPNGDVKYVYIFASIALLIFLIATVNFTNLTAARSSLRAREIGIRKAIGAFKGEILQQFLVEFILLGLISVVFAFVLVEVMLPVLSDIANAELDFTKINKKILLGTILLAGLVIGVFSSIYPAVYLMRFHPAEMMTGSVLTGFKHKQLRGILVIIQFVVTTFLLMTMLVSIRQLAFLYTADLGFTQQQVLIVPVAHTEARFKFDSMKVALLQKPSVLAVTAMEEVLGMGHRTHDYLPSAPTEKDKDWMFFPSLMVRENFFEVFEIPLVAGRYFGPGDEYAGVLVNEETVRFMGWESPQAALGMPLRSRAGNEKIIGVLKDFHYESLHNKVKPFVVDMPNAPFKFFYTRYMAIRLAPGAEQEALGHIRSVWESFVADKPFEHFFLARELGKQYDKEKQLSQITGYFSLVAILIACLGMFGLASFVMELRKREIAIRKAIGATNAFTVWLLLKEFFTLVSVALLIAWPVSYLVMDNWLRSFPFHATIPLALYLVSALIVFGVTFLTVSYHAVRAAWKEPSEDLQAQV